MTAEAGVRTRGALLVAARGLHALVALAAATGIGLELSRVFTEGPGDAGTTTERLVRLLSYFTIQSNVLVLLASALLAVRPGRSGRVMAVLQLDALLCIAVTGVVYHAVLAGEGLALTPSGEAANLLLHTVTPVGAWVAWLLVGPRPRFRWSTVGWSVLYPVVWIGYTFVRGAATGWYPYPFLDVAALGTATAARNTALVAAGFLALAVVVRGVERVLPATPAPTADAGPAAPGASAAETH
ncbi:Pr6Pr family membrane protein [Cellulomonas pakistanensis]|uniref:Integral membrane protein n=1 Tax=Cellulomonas pakistanensis TaxID=992287 RepID=A0A919U550_9CELL|nr:Pr6Pr family membrane protein [Cellulomonas pakistanensis]GIG35724.1 hypothetical protein Cpa01nite_11050 [Cellulomonas pakistanensis]